MMFPLTAYFEAAMKLADYDKLADGACRRKFGRSPRPRLMGPLR